jgi:hypothetical protein
MKKVITLSVRQNSRRNFVEGYPSLQDGQSVNEDPLPPQPSPNFAQLQCTCAVLQINFNT